MEPNQQTGSFGAAIGPGASESIKAAMARRGMGAGTTQQSSITPNLVPVPVSPTNAPTSATEANLTSIGGMPPQPKESELIIRALTDRLKTFSKIEESQNIPPKPLMAGGI